jgi:hypothetical protein
LLYLLGGRGNAELVWGDLKKKNGFNRKIL